MKLKTIFATFLFFSVVAFSQVKIKSTSISFYTMHDDKDWDTKVTVSLYLSDGTLVGTADYNNCNATSELAVASNCFCCVPPLYDASGRVITNPDKMTLFPGGSTKGPFGLKITNLVEKTKIKTGYLKVKINPNGNDRWIFIPNVVLTFDDGTTFHLNNYPTCIVAQDAPETTIVFN